MIRIAALVAICAGPAMADGDTFDLEVINENYALVTYHNSGARISSPLTTPSQLSDGDMIVDISVVILNGPEIITATPPEGWIAIPSRLNVVDGETGTIEIVRGEYLGS